MWSTVFLVGNNVETFLIFGDTRNAVYHVPTIFWAMRIVAHHDFRQPQCGLGIQSAHQRVALPKWGQSAPRSGGVDRETVGPGQGAVGGRLVCLQPHGP